MSLATQLSTKDQHVLSAIFQTDPEPPSTSVEVDVDMPPDRHVAQVEPLVVLEKQAIGLVEDGGLENLRRALGILDGIITREPRYASAYNNRAQLKRLMDGSTQQDIVCDLETAVSLARPENGERIRVSKMQGTILCQAYTQLGGMYLGMAEDADDSEKWALEEKASESLYNAGLFGNEIARAVASKVNPYAKLCGNIVQEALLAEYSKKY